MERFKNLRNVLLAGGMLFSFTHVAAGKSNECWILGTKTIEKAYKLGFSTVFVKDTTIKSKGLATFALIISLNTDKSKPNETLEKLVSNEVLYLGLEVMLTSPEGETVKLAYRYFPNSNGNIVLTFDEKYQKWECKDSCLGVKSTNLCGKTSHFRVAYTSGGNGWQTMDATYQESSNGGCSNKYNMNSLNFTGSSLSVSGGNLVFKNNSESSLSGDLNVGNNVLLQAVYLLSGKDTKGNVMNFELDAKKDETTGNYNAQFLNRNKYDSDFIMGETNCMLINFCRDTTCLNGSYGESKGKSTFRLWYEGTKRPAKYGQCMVFSGKVADTGNAVTLDGLEINYEVKKDEKTDQYLFAVVLGLNNSKQEKAEVLEAMMQWGMFTIDLEYKITDEKGNVETRKGRFTKHFGCLQHCHSDAFAGGHIRGKRITSVNLIVTNSCKDVYKLETNYQDGYNPKDTAGRWTETWDVEQYFTDECESKIQLKFGNASAAHESGLYIVKIELEKGPHSDVAAQIVVNLEITNCKGEVIYVDVKLTYNEKSQTYSGGLGIEEDNTCKLKVTDIKMNVYNQCGDIVKRNGFPTLITKMKDKIAKGDI